MPMAAMPATVQAAVGASRPPSGPARRTWAMGATSTAGAMTLTASPQLFSQQIPFGEEFSAGAAVPLIGAVATTVPQSWDGHENDKVFARDSGQK